MKRINRLLLRASLRSRTLRLTRQEREQLKRFQGKTFMIHKTDGSTVFAKLTVIFPGKFTFISDNPGKFTLRDSELYALLLVD